MEQVQCRNCDNGIWSVECCSGANGCDCEGREVNMGQCHVCNGTGFHWPDADTQANCNVIRGRCFIGRGPTRGYWAGK